VSSNGSRRGLEPARREILIALQSEALKPKPLLLRLKARGIGGFDARAAIWDLIDRRQIRYTQERRLALESSKKQDVLVH